VTHTELFLFSQIQTVARMSRFAHKIHVLGKLGEGSFADVFKVEFDGDPGLYALKRLRKRYRTFDEVKDLQEILILQALQGHPNIVNLVDVNFDPTTGYLILLFELLDQNLYQVLTEKSGPLEEQTSLLFAYQMLKGLAFMHSKNLFHRDIKPENCMVDITTMELKLVDFGSARSFADRQPFTEYIATRWYRAPECLLTAGTYGAPIDVWAVGCILAELLTGKPLFPGREEFEQLSLIHKVIGTPDQELVTRFLANPNEQFDYDFEYCAGMSFSEVLPGCARTTVDLVRSLLIYDPAKRLKASEALSHPALVRLTMLDRAWQKSDRSMPFAQFATENLKRMEEAQRVAAPSNHVQLAHNKMNKLLVMTRLKAAQRIKDYGATQH
jgi:renal tumor antigen